MPMLTSATGDNPRYLLADNRAYCDAAVRAALDAARAGMTEHAMAWAFVAGECGWHMHPGYYAHPQLEMMLQTLGEHIGDSASPSEVTLPPRRHNARTWLHVLTMALTVGGHTRLVERMILNTSAGNCDQHAIVLINQGDLDVPSWLHEAALSTGGGIVQLPSGTGFTDRVHMVRSLAREWADTVMLHVHPNDPVAPVAFATPGGPPVVLVNHADHVFWLGVRCADIVADIRPEGQQLTMNRRGSAETSLLPIPLEPFSGSPIRSSETRDLLGIDSNTVVLLAIASSYKFAPYGDLDFPSFAAELLKRNTGAMLLVVGPSETEECWRQAMETSCGRLRLLGVQHDIDRYYAAADICLESFPLGSLTSTLDAMLRGIPVIRAPKGTPPLLALTYYNGMEEPANGPEEYQQQVSRLIGNSGARRTAGEAQRQAVLDAHTGEGWLDAWQRLIHMLPATHNPRYPVNTAIRDAAEPLDYIWAEMQVRQRPKTLTAEQLFRFCVRATFRNIRRSELFRMWLSAIRSGNGKVIKRFFRDITKLNQRSTKNTIR